MIKYYKAPDGSLVTSELPLPKLIGYEITKEEYDQILAELIAIQEAEAAAAERAEKEALLA